MKITDLLTKEEIQNIKFISNLFKCEWVEINKVRYSAPKEKE